MNFQRLVGLLKKMQENEPFEDIIGYDHIKRLFRMALVSESRTHSFGGLARLGENNVSDFALEVAKERARISLMAGTLLKQV